MKDFKQVYISDTMEFFKKGYKEKHGLEDYYDVNAPAVFFGMYNAPDVEKMVNHKGPKIITWGGNDMQPYQLKLVADLQKQQQIYTWGYPGAFSDALSAYNIFHKAIYIYYKGYSKLFSPVPLGENIYVYKGAHGNRPDYFKWKEIVEPLQKVFGQDRVIYTSHLPINELVENYYKKCFCFVKPSLKGAGTTMLELAHMGIRTIGKGQKNLDFFTEYNDMNHLIELIMEESKYMGKIRNDIAEYVRNIFTENEWLTLKFWEK